MILEGKEGDIIIDKGMVNEMLIGITLAGPVAAVKILLDREDVNPNYEDEEGATALSHAAYLGREEVVKMLLDREEVDPNQCSQRARPFVGRPIGHRPGQARPL